MKTVMVLGASSWIGHHLYDSLKKYFPGHKIIGSYNSHKPQKAYHYFQASNSEWHIFEDQLSQYNPEVIFNLNRGEDEVGFELHQKLIEHCNGNDVHYAYFSSFNALDENTATDHHEDEAPHAQSDYGKFKARCEKELTEKGKHYCIYRFAATHGWGPARKSRTELFLEKLKNGESVTVVRGVKQNRTATPMLTDMMAAIASKGGQGVFHLGTIDYSEEIDFLRELAALFGYPASRILPGEESKCNAFMIPKKLFELCGEEFMFSEEDTLRMVAQEPELQKYRA